MAEAKVKKAKPVKPKVSKLKGKTYFPKLLILYGLICTAAPLIEYFNLYKFPELTIEILLLLAGLWMFKMGVKQGFSKKRKERLMKYI